LESQIKEALTMDSPVSLLQYYGDDSLGVREINELERAGYLTLRAFLGASEQDLLMIRNFGGVTLSRFRALRVRLVQELGTGRPVNRLEAILKG
jgi:DNA-directed RNA polymerase alpha subunit